MIVWIIEPRDPLIVRDGRPFGPDPGVRAVSLAFPFPSTTTGALRSQVGMDADGIFRQTEEQLVDLKRIAVRGPLLVELSEDNRIADWLLPAPADALLFEKDEHHPAIRRQLVPLAREKGDFTDLPEDLAPVGLAHPDPRKPQKDAPAFWRWEHFADWLTNPQAELPIPDDLGHGGPTRESRIHVKRDPSRGTSEDGKLFETEGREYTRGGAGRQALSQARRLALAIVCEREIPHRQPVDTLGGERRMVVWRRSNRELPTIPAGLAEQITHNKHCRLILLTPAHFSKGYCPDWLLQPRNSVTPHLAAAAVGRPQVVSGWDYAANTHRGAPKPTRRLAPAGSVYFLHLEGEKEAIRRWVEDTWMGCVSDDQQSRDDGFGLAVLGTWDGELHPIKTEEYRDGSQTA